MTLPHFFIDDQILAKEQKRVFPLRLSNQDCKHARVLRITQGEHIAVIDADTKYYECSVASFDGCEMNVCIATKLEQRTIHHHLTLVQGLAKGEKMENIVRQGTELGIKTFVPFMSQRSVVKLEGAKKIQKQKRWQSIARSAAMQSAQTQIPRIYEPSHIKEIAKIATQASVLLICWEEETQVQCGSFLRSALKTQDIKPDKAHVVLVIGPEGGLDREEIRQLCALHPFASTVSLAPSILRTETAAIVASTLVLHELGVLG